jgi:hypothetical protein
MAAVTMHAARKKTGTPHFDQAFCVFPRVVMMRLPFHKELCATEMNSLAVTTRTARYVNVVTVSIHL